MVQITELGYIGLNVSDMKEWKTFATQIMGLEMVEGATDTFCQLRADYWHRRFDLIASDNDGLAYLGFRVAGRNEFAQMQLQLSDNGIEFTVGTVEQAAERHVLEILFTQDPAGFKIEIFHGPQIDAHKPFHPGRPMHGRFKTGAGGLGHVELGHKDVRAAHAFYSALGMRGDIEYPGENAADRLDGPTFMHCNERDHTVGFGMGPHERLYHIMLEADNLSDFGLTYDIARKAGVAVMLEPGRHSNDTAMTFYVYTPSGWAFEMGYGSRGSTHQSEYYPEDIFGHEPGELK